MVSQRVDFVNIFRSDDGTLIAIDAEGKAYERTSKGTSHLASEAQGKWVRFSEWDAPRKPPSPHRISQIQTKIAEAVERTNNE